jgi:predicted permease
VTGQLADAFLQVVVPVLLIGVFGFLLGRARPVDLAPITALAVSVLVPGVVFDSLTRGGLPRTLVWPLLAHVLVQLVCLGLLTVLAAWLLGWTGRAQAALLLASLFSNSGNVGLALARFAFGEEGFAIAGGWFAISSLTMQTVGVFIAARAHAGPRAALRHFVRLPVAWAMFAGLAVNLSGVTVPGPLAKASQLLSSGSIAVLLVLLGLQLARLPLGSEVRGATVATALRLFVAPPVAWVTGRALGLEGVALAVAVLQASTPTAVTAALWAMEFDTRPALVSAAVVLSTLVGVVTITILVAVLSTAPV